MIDGDQYRGTGRTSKQLEEALKFAEDNPDRRVIYFIHRIEESTHTKFLLERLRPSGPPKNFQVATIGYWRERMMGVRAKAFIDHHARRCTEHHKLVEIEAISSRWDK